MAVQTDLCLQVFEDGNCEILRVMDCSVIPDEFVIDTFEICVTLPDFDDPVCIDLEPGFNEVIDSLDLGITEAGDDLVSLSDGLWTLRLNITGHIEAGCNAGDYEEFTEYYTLRQCQAYCLYHKKLCALQLDTCDSCNKAKQANIEKLMTIRMYLEAAKAEVEECGAPNKGLELHNYAVKLLAALDIDCTNCK